MCLLNTTFHLPNIPWCQLQLDSNSLNPSISAAKQPRDRPIQTQFGRSADGSAVENITGWLESHFQLDPLDLEIFKPDPHSSQQHFALLLINGIKLHISRVWNKAVRLFLKIAQAWPNWCPAPVSQNWELWIRWLLRFVCFPFQTNIVVFVKFIQKPNYCNSICYVYILVILVLGWDVFSCWTQHLWFSSSWLFLPYFYVQYLLQKFPGWFLGCAKRIQLAKKQSSKRKKTKKKWMYVYIRTQYESQPNPTNIQRSSTCQI